MKQPPKGFTTDARIVRIIDGDTVDIEVVRKVRVRLEDCWCPETRTRDREEKVRGYAAKRHLRDFIWEHGADLVVFIAASDDNELKDIFTFGRVVGRVFVDGVDISEMMVSDGHATKSKAG